MYWYLKALKQYADFNGRANRQEYWMFFLFNLLFAFTSIFLDSLLLNMPTSPIYAIYSLATILPSLAILVRRLHDVGKSGWFVFIALIPLIGAIWIFILLVQESDPKENEYGPISGERPARHDHILDA